MHRLLGYHQSYSGSTRLTKWPSELSFLWTFGQFCRSEQTLCNAKCKIFAYKIFRIHRVNVVNNFEIINSPFLLNYHVSNHCQNAILEFLNLHLTSSHLPSLSIETQDHLRYCGCILQHIFNPYFLLLSPILMPAV